jgi:hypothetical protein
MSFGKITLFDKGRLIHWNQVYFFGMSILGDDVICKKYQKNGIGRIFEKREGTIVAQAFFYLALINVWKSL